jgi:transposase
MASIPEPLPRRVVVGVDTHKYAHVAVALDQVGAVLDRITIKVDRVGYAQLRQRSTGLGEQVEFGVEGCGSYGAGLVSHLRRAGHRVIEVNRRTDGSDTCAARTTPSMPRPRPARSWLAPPPPCRRPPTAPWR